VALKLKWLDQVELIVDLLRTPTEAIWPVGWFASLRRLMACERFTAIGD